MIRPASWNGSEHRARFGPTDVSFDDGPISDHPTLRSSRFLSFVARGKASKRDVEQVGG